MVFNTLITKLKSLNKFADNYRDSNPPSLQTHVPRKIGAGCASLHPISNPPTLHHSNTPILSRSGGISPKGRDPARAGLRSTSLQYSPAVAGFRFAQHHSNTLTSPI